jgi:hypothetical protein
MIETLAVTMLAGCNIIAAIILIKVHKLNDNSFNLLNKVNADRHIILHREIDSLKQLFYSCNVPQIIIEINCLKDFIQKENTSNWLHYNKLFHELKVIGYTSQADLLRVKEALDNYFKISTVDKSEKITKKYVRSEKTRRATSARMKLFHEKRRQQKEALKQPSHSNSV